MPVRIVVGANWGDEGKGRMVDYFAAESDFVVRFQGGSNAGHTIVNHLGKFALRLVPSGIFFPDVVNVVGPGTVVNLEALTKEIEALTARGIKITPANLKISERACICFPFHILQDGYEEERLGAHMFGSTRQGIAPVYGDRFMKQAVQVGALRDMSFVASEVRRCLDLKNLLFERIYGKPPVPVSDMVAWTEKYGSQLLPFVTDVSKLLDHAEASGKRILLEAQLGALRDVIYGIYPYTTSSHPSSGYGCLGAGIFTPVQPNVTAVVKAFATCVGEGPFVTELDPEIAQPFRERTGEFGAATGRPRRIGHFDAVATCYGVRAQGSSEIALTKLDNLSEEKTLNICTQYSIDGNLTTDFPLFPLLRNAKPVYVQMPGWHEDIREARTFDSLPANARNYVTAIEDLLRVPIKYISVGPERHCIIVR